MIDDDRGEYTRRRFAVGEHSDWKNVQPTSVRCLIPGSSFQAPHSRLLTPRSLFHAPHSTLHRTLQNSAHLALALLALVTVIRGAGHGGIQGVLTPENM